MKLNLRIRIFIYCAIGIIIFLLHPQYIQFDKFPTRYRNTIEFLNGEQLTFSTPVIHNFINDPKIFKGEIYFYDENIFIKYEMGANTKYEIDENTKDNYYGIANGYKYYYRINKDQDNFILTITV